MFDICVACHKLIWFWQKTGYNSSWHQSCMLANDKGYSAARNFAKTENIKHNLPTPDELYGRRGSTGEMLPPSKWRNQKYDWTQAPIHEHMKHLYPTEEAYESVMEWVKIVAEGKGNCHVVDTDLELVDPYPEE